MSTAGGSPKESFVVEGAVITLCALIAIGVYFLYQAHTPASSPAQSAAQTTPVAVPQQNTPVIASFQRIPIANVGNLTTETYGYHITNNQVICTTQGCGGNLLMQASASSFTFLYTTDSTVEEPPYTADAHNVYCDGRLLPGADPNTFDPLLAQWSAKAGDYGVRYAKDAAHVYFNCSVLPEADAATFVAVSGSATQNAQDKNHSYFNGKVVQ